MACKHGAAKPTDYTITNGCSPGPLPLLRFASTKRNSSYQQKHMFIVTSTVGKPTIKQSTACNAT
jgi:hypothetical protein